MFSVVNNVSLLGRPNVSEPDDDARDADEDSVEMRQDLHGHWNDAPRLRSFVCAMLDARAVHKW